MCGPRVLAWVVLVTSMAPGALAAGFTDGFDTGTLDPGWIAAYGAYPSVVTSADNGYILPHSGTYMAYTPRSDSITFPCVSHTVGTPSAGTVTVYVNSDGFDAAHNFWIAIAGPDSAAVWIVNNAAVLQVRVPSGNVLTGITITARVWHEVKFVVSAVTGTDVYWDGTLVLTGEMGIVAVNKIEFGTNWGCALTAYDDISFVPATATGKVTNVTGTVALTGYTGSYQDVSLRVELMRGGAVVRTVRVNPDVAGKFAVPVVASDIYDIGIKAYGHLRKVLTGQAIYGPTVDLGTITLVTGDADGDNEVSSTDLSIVLANLNLAGDL